MIEKHFNWLVGVVVGLSFGSFLPHSGPFIAFVILVVLLPTVLRNNQEQK